MLFCNTFARPWQGWDLIQDNNKLCIKRSCKKNVNYKSKNCWVKSIIATKKTVSLQLLCSLRIVEPHLSQISLLVTRGRGSHVSCWKMHGMRKELLFATLKVERILVNKKCKQKWNSFWTREIFLLIMVLNVFVTIT